MRSGQPGREFFCALGLGQGGGCGLYTLYTHKYTFYFHSKMDNSVEYLIIRRQYTLFCEKYMADRKKIPLILYVYPVDNE